MMKKPFWMIFSTLLQLALILNTMSMKNNERLLFVSSGILLVLVLLPCLLFLII